MSTRPVYTVIRFDTEDFILHQSDDSAMRLAHILSDLNVMGNFNITGKKVETLLERGRRDVIKALSFHDISYHSYGHSIHPNVREYLKYMEWDEGVREFVRKETRGIAYLQEAFGRSPSGYGQAGGTWTPHAYGAMRKLGMPVFVGGGTYVQMGSIPMWYCGILQMRTEPWNTIFDNLDNAKARHLEGYQKAKRSGGGLLNFCAHDCQYVTGEWWDGINFADGNNPPLEKYKIPKLFSQKRQEELFSVFKAYVEYVLSLDNSEIVTPSELHGLYRDKTREKKFSKQELVSLSKACLDGIDCQKVDVGYVSAAEIFSMLVCSVGEFLDTGKFPEESFTKNILGPVRRNETAQDLSKLNTESFLKSILDTRDFIEFHDRIPSEVWVGAMTVSPVDYMVTICYYLPQFVKANIPQQFDIKQGKFLSERYVVEPAEIEVLWRWLEREPQGKFQAPKLVELAKLQTWTAKPATLA